MAKTIKLEMKKYKMGRKHRSADQLVAHLNEIRRAAVGQVNGRNKDPFYSRNMKKLSRGAVGGGVQKPRMPNKSPPTMKQKLQMDGVSGPARGALPGRNVGWLGAAAQRRKV